MNRSVRQLFWVLSLPLLGLPACGVGGVPPRAEFDRFEGPAGQWIEVDFAVQTARSHDADPAFGLPELRAAMATTGLDMAVVADHTHSTGSLAYCDESLDFAAISRCVEAHPNRGPEPPDPGALVSAEGPRLIPGMRITVAGGLGQAAAGESGGYVDCLPLDPDAFAAITAPVADRPLAEVTGGTALEACRARNGLPLLLSAWGTTSEPFAAAAWNPDDADWAGLHLAPHGRWETESDRAWNAWICDRLSGRPRFAVAASNSHGPAPRAPEVAARRPGALRTSVYVDRAEWPAVLQAAAAAQTVFHLPGVFVEFRVYDPAGRYLGFSGSRIQADTGSELRIAIRAQAGQVADLELVFVPSGACTPSDAEPEPRVATLPVPTERRLEQWRICTNGDCPADLRTTWSNVESGLLYLRLLAADGAVLARTAPASISTRREGFALFSTRDVNEGGPP